jgi:hypothetical protein
MNQDAIRAHVKLLESWPREKIRTHERPEPRTRGNNRGVRPPHIEAAIRRARIAKLMKETNPLNGKRWTECEMAALLGVTRVSVQNYKRALRGKR